LWNTINLWITSYVHLCTSSTRYRNRAKPCILASLLSACFAEKSPPRCNINSSYQLSISSLCVPSQLRSRTSGISDPYATSTRRIASISSPSAIASNMPKRHMQPQPAVQMPYKFPNTHMLLLFLVLQPRSPRIPRSPIIRRRAAFTSIVTVITAASILGLPFFVPSSLYS